MKLLYAEDEIGMSEAVVDILLYHTYFLAMLVDLDRSLRWNDIRYYDA